MLIYTDNLAYFVVEQKFLLFEEVFVVQNFSKALRMDSSLLI